MPARILCLDSKNDLNAMRMVLNQHFGQIHGGNESAFEHELFTIICRDNGIDYSPHVVNLWMATAAQYDEAFQKWKKLTHA